MTRILLMLSTAIVLTGIGTSAGIALAWIGIRQLLALAPDNIPRADTVAIDLIVLIVTVVIALAAAFVFALVPAVSAFRMDLVPVLSGAGRSAGLGGRRRPVPQCDRRAGSGAVCRAACRVGIDVPQLPRTAPRRPRRPLPRSIGNGSSTSCSR